MRNRKILSAMLALIFGVYASLSFAEATKKTVDIIEKDIVYQPAEKTVHVGQALNIINQDPFFHKSRISKLKKDGREGEIVLEAAKELPNTQREHHFTEPGDYKIRCMIHDGMTAIIHVIN